MRRLLHRLKRLTAFRIGLATGLAFALLHVVQVMGSRHEIPLLTRVESALTDLRFQQRGKRPHSGRVVIAAVDEASIAKFGRFPWDWRVFAALVDKLNDEGADAIGFDMSFSDRDASARPAEAVRLRQRFGEIALSSPRGKAAIETLGGAEADVVGAAADLDAGRRSLGRKSGRPTEGVSRRLDQGGGKLATAKQALEGMAREQDAYAAELDRELGGKDPDVVFGEAIARARDKVVLGFIAHSAQEMSAFSPAQIEENVARIERGRIGKPEFRLKLAGGTEQVQALDRTSLKEYPGLVAPLPPIAAGATSFGFFNTAPDADGVIRASALGIKVRGRTFPSLDAALVATVLHIKPERVVAVTADDGSTGRSNIDSFDFDGKLRVPTDVSGLLQINYYGGDGTFTNYSIADILDGKLAKGALRGKVVLVGATAQGTFDQRVTPFEKMTAGVETHANAVETMLSRKFLRRDLVVQWLEVLFLVALALAFALLFSRVKVTLCLPVVVLAALAVHGGSSALFGAGFLVYDAMPLLELGSMFVFVTLFRYAIEERDKRQLRKAFQLYLNPDVMEEMLGAPERLQLGGEERELTVLFSDIRGFTTISEQLSPQALVHLLNEYLSPMTDIVFARKGTLDKYIGDAVMAFFGAPLRNDAHARDACAVALEMLAALSRLRERWERENPGLPEIDIGIGINSGPMVVGNMGSSQRFSYTVIGDNVNLASRLEGLNKEYGTHTLISEATLLAARRASDGEALDVRELDSVQVKGKSEPVRLFELRGKGMAPTEDLPLLSGYASALELYRSQRFSEARLEFESLVERFPSDGPSRLFVARCDRMVAAPPGEGWDGVYKMEHK